MRSWLGLAASVCLISLGCAIKRPCSEAGDTSWNPTFEKGGDKFCNQLPDKKGVYLNHGRYVHKYLSGKPAVVGNFKEGKKDGIWQFFDEKGELKIEKYYRNGVETNPALPLPEDRKLNYQ